MKNQYFGDNRDLFKYDLLLRIAQGMLQLRRNIEIISMLTPDDGSRQGNQVDRSRAKAGTKNERLRRFLDKCLSEDRRHVKEIEKYFSSEGMRARVNDESFSHDGRRQYFRRVVGRGFRSALVFIDPDIGLEIKRSGEKHCLRDEVQLIYDVMDSDSVFVIYQHLVPWEKNTKDFTGSLDARCQKLGKIINDIPLYLSDDEIMFFLMTKSRELKRTVALVLEQYQVAYENLRLYTPRFPAPRLLHLPSDAVQQ